MAHTAAAMYGAAALDGLVEGLLPGGPAFSVVPIVVVLAIFAVLATVGPRLPRPALSTLGPLGVGLTAYALGTTSGVTDGAVLYALPVLWQTLFFGRRGAALIVGCVAVAETLALLALPAGLGYPERWVDVMVSVSAIAIVVLALEHRNEQLLERLAAEARHDPLTGLLNRRGFDERAAIELAHVRRNPRPMALVTFDIDYFKRVNDEWGHDTGDQVLRHIGELLAVHARDIDILARFGGEEFVVLLPDTDDAGAHAFGDRVRRELATRPAAGLPRVRMSAGAAAGVAITDVRTLIQQADSALYEAKRTGRDRTHVYREPARHTATGPPDEPGLSRPRPGGNGPPPGVRTRRG
jgi:diguanylate cyclase (GGDEF)-like protein